MYEHSDVLCEIKAVREKPEYSTLLSFFDTASGVNPTISKLPPGLQTNGVTEPLHINATIIYCFRRSHSFVNS